MAFTIHFSIIDPMCRLIAENLAKRFESRKVFSGIEFDCRTPDVLALVGYNGSGKSTLIKTLLGEFRPTRGTVRFSRNIKNGDEVSMNEDDIRRSSALVSPYLNLYDGLTGEENLVFLATVGGYSITGKRTNELLELVGLANRGVDLVEAYSSGMKQRLKYAAALLNDPLFLFLDEPTANLDDDGKRIVFDLIERQRQHSLIVIATNEAEDKRCATQFCKLG